MLLALLTLLPGPRAEAGDLNPEWGSAAYQPFSIFRPDGPELGPRVVVVFHGFRSAVPNGTFKRLHGFFAGTHSVVGVNYDYFDIDGTIAGLEAFAAELAGSDVTVIGTSLGGFWADWFASRIGAARAVLVNPVTAPADVLAKYVGQRVESERRGIFLIPTAAEVARYGEVAFAPDPAVAVLTIVALDDDPATARATAAIYGSRAGARVLVYETGGHTLDLRVHPAGEAIRSFVLGE